MTATGEILKDKKIITPLVVIALFLSLTEIVLGVVAFKTTGGIQIALTVFVIFFPLFIAGLFFYTLWYKPVALHPPDAYGGDTSARAYAEATQSPSIPQQQSSGKQSNQPATAEEKRTIDVVVDYFMRGIPLAGWILLYACSISYEKKTPFNLRALSSVVTSIEYEFAVGFLAATQSMRLIDITLLKDILNVTDMNETLSERVKTKLKGRIESKRIFAGLDEATREKFIAKLLNDVALVEKYFN